MSYSLRMRSSALLLAALLSACTPGPTGAPAAAPGAAPGTAPAAAIPVAPAAPGAPIAAPPAVLELTSLQGRVSLGGKAWSNATLKVFDAIKDRPADLFAPGAKPTGTTDLAVEATGLTTNANGDFTLNVANFKPGMMARVVATVGSQTLTAVITADGKTPGGYKVQAVFGCYVNEVSKMLDQIARGVLKMASGLKPEFAKDAIDEMMVKLNALGPKLQAAFSADPSLAAKVAAAPMSSSGVVLNETAINSVLSSAGLTDAINAVVLNAVGDLAAQAALPGTVVNQDAFKNVEFIGTSVDVNVISGGELVVSDDGKTVSSTPISSGSPPGDSTSTSGSGGNGAARNADDFTPVLAQFVFNGEFLSLGVTQSKNEDDIETIIVRVPANNVGIAPILPDNLAVAGSRVQQGALDRPLSVDRSAGASDSSDISGFNTAYSLSDEDTLATPDFKGFVTVDRDGANIKIATCHIYSSRGAGNNFHYVVLKYNTGGGVELNGGHVSTLNLAGFTNIVDNTQAQVFMRSRKGNRFQPSLSDTLIDVQAGPN